MMLDMCLREWKHAFVWARNLFDWTYVHVRMYICYVQSVVCVSGSESEIVVAFFMWG